MKSKGSPQYQDQKDPAKGKGGKSGGKGLAAMRAAKSAKGKQK